MYHRIASPQSAHLFYTTPIKAHYLIYTGILYMGLTRSILVFLFLSTTSGVTVLGNFLVVISIWKEAGLHSPTNYFIASLAIADLLVGAIVIPFEAITELLNQKWLFGPIWCDLWRALDVLLATSSILNLSVISLDRYLAISQPFTYHRRMSYITVGKLIAIVWLCSSFISMPAIFYWKWTRGDKIPPDRCLFTQDPLYLLASSTISFYIPLLLMVFAYFKIYRAAIRQTKSIALGSKYCYDEKLEKSFNIRIHRGRSLALRAAGDNMELQSFSELPQQFKFPGSPNSPSSPATPNSSSLRIKKRMSKFTKEKRAAKTLAIVLGVFIICWMPFFVMNVVAGLCVGCDLQSSLLFSLFTWLGWINSAMNPFIYAARNKDFRKAFGRMLCCARVRSFFRR